MAGTRPPRRRARRAARLTTVRVPEPIQPTFLRAQDFVARYFSRRRERPQRGTLSISGERYVLARAASMSVEFFDLVTSLYQDKGPLEAGRVASNLLFDMAHAIGKADARSIHRRMDVRDPIEKLSAGPIHFSFSGWAFVDIFAESHPSPDGTAASSWRRRHASSRTWRATRARCRLRGGRAPARACAGRRSASPSSSSASAWRTSCAPPTRPWSGASPSAPPN